MKPSLIIKFIQHVIDRDQKNDKQNLLDNNLVNLFILLTIYIYNKILIFQYKIVEMNILPKKYSQFLDKDYWNKFFNKLKKNSSEEFFEWYGSFAQFKIILTKLIHEKSKILNIGCGKSLFAQQMLQSNIYQIVSCDYSQQVILDMKKRPNSQKYGLKYEVADVFDLKYQNESFDYIVDKGTLDAIFPEQNQENIKRLQQNFLPKIINILRKQVGSKYIIISLLQIHILKLLLNYFKNQKNFQVNIYEQIISKSKLHPFLVSIEYVQNKQSHNVNIHLLANKSHISVNNQQAQNIITKLHVQMQFNQKIKKISLGQYFTLNVYSQKQEIRYGIQVLDNVNQKILDKLTCAIFIVPQGKQGTFLYGTQKGIRMLHEQINYSRLIIVKLITGNTFQNLQIVKKQLNEIVPDIIPKGCKINQVPYMTDSDQLGERSYLYKDKDYIIQEVKIDDNILRRLIIGTNLGMIQSQYRLTYFNQKNPQKQHLKQINKYNLLLPKKKGMLVGIDSQYLAEGYQRPTITSFNLLDDKIVQNAKVLVLGGGACVLSRFLHDNYKFMDITTVQIDKKIIQLSQKYFQIIQNQRFHVIINDAIVFVAQAALKVQNKYDIIIFDINGSEGKPSPQQIFLTQQFIGNLKKILSEEGLLIFHLINNQTPKLFQKFFNPIYTHIDELVTMVYCLNKPLIKKLDNNKKQVIITRKEYQTIPKKKNFRFPWEEEIISDIKIYWPKVGGIFQGSQIFYEQNGQLLNNAKQMYKKDFEKVNKKKKKNR